MKQKLFIALSVILFIVLDFYITEVMEKVSNFANQYGEIVRTTATFFNLVFMLGVLGGYVCLAFYTYTKNIVTN